MVVCKIGGYCFFRLFVIRYGRNIQKFCVSFGEQNRFFIEKTVFPFLTDGMMPFTVVFSVFGSCLVVYGAYYGMRAILGKKEKAKEI